LGELFLVLKFEIILEKYSEVRFLNEGLCPTPGEILFF